MVNWWKKSSRSSKSATMADSKRTTRSLSPGATMGSVSPAEVRMKGKSKSFKKPRIRNRSSNYETLRPKGEKVLQQYALTGVEQRGILKPFFPDPAAELRPREKHPANYDAEVELFQTNRMAEIEADMVMISAGSKELSLNNMSAEPPPVPDKYVSLDAESDDSSSDEESEHIYDEIDLKPDERFYEIPGSSEVKGAPNVDLTPTGGLMRELHHTQEKEQVEKVTASHESKVCSGINSPIAQQLSIELSTKPTVYEIPTGKAESETLMDLNMTPSDLQADNCRKSGEMTRHCANFPVGEKELRRCELNLQILQRAAQKLQIGLKKSAEILQINTERSLALQIKLHIKNGVQPAADRPTAGSTEFGHYENSRMFPFLPSSTDRFKSATLKNSENATPILPNSQARVQTLPQHNHHTFQLKYGSLLSRKY